ncbi:MAG TPA: ArsA-related P-loop ATPase [Acidimicrobiales bacterium]|nr:ArsA-related P-loop ATPase [Acidimicrobiales bacterium]
MRIAFVGKGGVGKSAIAGTFCRALARQGHPVLALDSDPLPGLAYSLGLPIDDAPIPEDAIEERAEGEQGPRFRLRTGLTASEAVDRYAVTAPDGVRFLQFGKHRGQTRALFKSQFVWRQIVRELPDGRWNVVGDLPGGTRQPFNGWGDYARLVLVVVEPTAKSLLTARRLARLALDENHPRRIVAVANKVREDGDVETVARRTGLEVVGAVPWDEALAEAEQKMAAPIDMAPDSEAVRAVESLVEQLSEERIG